jgi:hypothetical protein
MAVGLGRFGLRRHLSEVACTEAYSLKLTA